MHAYIFESFLCFFLYTLRGTLCTGSEEIGQQCRGTLIQIQQQEGIFNAVGGYCRGDSGGDCVGDCLGDGEREREDYVRNCERDGEREGEIMGEIVRRLCGKIREWCRLMWRIWG